MKELSFREVIANIKEGEVWESEDRIIKYSNKTITIETKNGEVFNGIGFCDEILFRLQRRQYTFQEAFKEFEKGREIESCVSEYCYKLREDSILKRHYSVERVEIWEEDEDLIKINEIRGVWYIND